VYPLFSVESCVIFAEKDSETTYPIETRLMVGRLRSKNASMRIVSELIQKGTFKITDRQTLLTNIGKRVSWDYEGKLEIGDTQSGYMQLFRQGATIVPGPFWFIQLVLHSKFSITPDEPFVESSNRSIKMADKNYRGIIFSGKIESRYLFSTLRGSDILPFCHFPYRSVILPVRPNNANFRLVTKEDALSAGHNYLYQWLLNAEEKWQERRQGKYGKMSIYQRLNRSNGITSQHTNPNFAVLYNSAGRGNLISCILDLRNPIEMTVNGFSFISRGFIAEHKTYVYYPNTIEEAYYIAAILNSNYVFSILKRIKSARDIEKKIWELPISIYDDTNNSHLRLSQLGKSYSHQAVNILKDETNKFDSLESLSPSTVGNLRKAIKSGLSKEIDEIDSIMKVLLSKPSVAP
jgi:hypothetical protein